MMNASIRRALPLLAIGGEYGGSGLFSEDRGGSFWHHNRHWSATAFGLSHLNQPMVYQEVRQRVDHA